MKRRRAGLLPGRPSASLSLVAAILAAKQRQAASSSDGHHNDRPPHQPVRADTQRTVKRAQPSAAPRTAPRGTQAAATQESRGGRRGGGEEYPHRHTDCHEAEAEAEGPRRCSELAVDPKTDSPQDHHQRIASAGEASSLATDSTVKPMPSDPLHLRTKRAMAIESAIQRLLTNGRKVQTARRAGRKSQLVWRVFPRQELCFQWADSQDQPSQDPDAELRFFSVEGGANGQRSFLASPYSTFWLKYNMMERPKRHYYELIRQGWPCHLYFDLEYARQSNPGLDGMADAMVDALVGSVEAVVRKRFRLPDRWRVQNDWVLEMDSSSDKKFSRHLVVHLQDNCGPVAFRAELCMMAFSYCRSNIHVGELVREVVGHALSPDGCPEMMMVRKPEGGTTPFVDLAVYTRNRVFRLVYSCKMGKAEVLVPTARYAGSRPSSERNLFLKSLVCNVPSSAKILQMFDDIGGEVRPLRPGAAPLPESEASGGRQTPWSSSSPQPPPSPYPKVDRFVKSLCRQGGRQGAVRSWLLLGEAGVLILNIRGNRWCGNINREHKSNGIFFVVDVQGGCWYQKCYDPECRNYRSEPMPLPACSLPQPDCQVAEGAATGWAEDEEDALFLQALDEYEQDSACEQALVAYEKGDHGA